jgi:hypothetical protein
VILLVPSRGRPQRAASMALSAIGTATDAVNVILIVDADDPELAEYLKLSSYEHVTVIVLPERIGYTASLNAVARDLWDVDTILGAFGDDVCFQTAGWDRQIRDALATPGIAYGDDLVHGQNHPTAVFMSSEIARALGWLALPATTHQWADDGWKALGTELGLLRFVPIIVEHLHPVVGKAEWDDVYRSVFDDERAKADFEGYSAWLERGLEDDAARVRAALDL